MRRVTPQGHTTIDELFSGHSKKFRHITANDTAGVMSELDQRYLGASGRDSLKNREEVEQMMQDL